MLAIPHMGKDVDVRHVFLHVHVLLSKDDARTLPSVGAELGTCALVI